MNNKMRFFFLIMMAVGSLVFCGCKGGSNAEEPVAADTVIAEPEPEAEPLFEAPEVEEPQEDLFEKAQQAQRTAVRKPAPKEEVLYIRGYGANGTVWGHITMKGDKGRGTVTDENENALTITCTRQGEELIAYDQNSRQYIFKL